MKDRHSITDRFAASRWSTIALALSFAVLFLLTHPYTGIRHDAILYTAQALYNDHPARYSHDLFFEFGSQDAWTIYGRIYGKLVSAFGIRTSNLVGLIAAQLIWWTGAWRLTKKLLPAPWHWLSLFLIACLPAVYGPGLIFSYDEGFLTARLPAEALGLWAIAMTLERRYWVAVVLTLVAVAIHPLIGSVSFIVVVLGRMHRVKWWTLLPFGLLAFAVIQLLPFHALHLHPFDPQWRALVRSKVPYLFVNLWDMGDWSRACWVIALPAAIWATQAGDQRTLWSNLTLLGVAGVAVAALAGLTGQDAFWIQVQPWRVLWLLTVMQWPAAILLVRHEGRTRPALIWMFAICWLLLDVGGGIVALMIAAALHMQARRGESGTHRTLFGNLSAQLRYALLGLTVIAAIVWFIYGLAYHHAREVYPTGSLALGSSWLEALIHTRFVVALVALLFMLSLSGDRRVIIGLSAVLAALTAYGLINLDQRSEPAKIMEARTDRAGSAPFEGIVMPGATVYWDGPGTEIVYPWLMMKTSSYYSTYQTSGMIFHRRTTFEAMRRLRLIKQGSPAVQPHGANDADGKLDVQGGPPSKFVALTEAGIRHVCADPVLDFIVSDRHYADLATGDTWSPTPGKIYWLYDCHHIRTTATVAGQQQ